MVISNKKSMKSIAWSTLVALVLVGCSGGADVADNSSQFQSPAGRTISNNDSPSTGSQSTIPSNPATTAPDAPTVNPTTGANEPSEPAEPTASDEPSIQDVLDKLASLEEGIESANSSAEAAAENADRAASEARSAKSNAKNAAIIAGVGAGLVGLASILGDVFSTKAINNTTREEAALTELRLRQAMAGESDDLYFDLKDDNTRVVAEVAADADERQEGADTRADARQDETNRQLLTFGQQIETLEGKIGDLTTEIQGYNTNLAELSEQVQAASEDYASFQADAERQAVLFGAVTGALQGAGTYIRSLDQQIEQIQTELNELSGENTELKAQLSELVNERNEAIANLNTLQGNFSELAEKYEAALAAAVEAPPAVLEIDDQSARVAESVNVDDRKVIGELLTRLQEGWQSLQAWAASGLEQIRSEEFQEALEKIAADLRNPDS